MFIHKDISTALALYDVLVFLIATKAGTIYSFLVALCLVQAKTAMDKACVY